MNWKFVIRILSLQRWSWCKPRRGVYLLVVTLICLYMVVSRLPSGRSTITVLHTSTLINWTTLCNFKIIYNYSFKPIKDCDIAKWSYLQTISRKLFKRGRIPLHSISPGSSVQPQWIWTQGYKNNEQECDFVKYYSQPFNANEYICFKSKLGSSKCWCN